MRNGEKSSGEGGGTRWWEFYFVRYAMGTVIGGVLFYVLCQASPVFGQQWDDPVLLQFLQLPTDPSQLTTAHLFLFLAYGLTYCYIASAPVLVFHSARFALRQYGIHWVSFLVVCSMILGCIASLGIAILLGQKIYSVFVLLASVVCAVWFAQVVSVIWTIKNGDFVYESYRKLDELRRLRTATFLDSYRHLREHGNSFFIVFCEIVFACALSLAGTEALAVRPFKTPVDYGLALLVIVLAWVVPAMLVWLVATRIELNQFTGIEWEVVEALSQPPRVLDAEDKQ